MLRYQQLSYYTPKADLGKVFLSSFHYHHCIPNSHFYCPWSGLWASYIQTIVQWDMCIHTVVRQHTWIQGTVFVWLWWIDICTWDLYVAICCIILATFIAVLMVHPEKNLMKREITPTHETLDSWEREHVTSHVYTYTFNLCLCQMVTYFTMLAVHFSPIVMFIQSGFAEKFLSCSGMANPCMS